MGSPDIETWRVTTSGSAGIEADDGLEIDDIPGGLGDARVDWPAFIEEYAMQKVLSSKTKERTAFLNGQLAALAKDTEILDSEAFDLFRVLVITYPRYIDQASREAVERALLLLASRRSVLVHIIQWIKTEAERVCSGGSSSSSAASSRFILLKWCCICYPIEAVHTNTASWMTLLECMAILFHSLLDENSYVKHAIRRTSVVCTRRAFRTMPLKVKDAIATLIELAKLKKDNLYLIPLLGLTLDVMHHLKHIPEDTKIISENTKNDIVTTYTSVLMSKVAVPKSVYGAFDGFIQRSVTIDDLKLSIVPVMEKFSLRSPDLSLPVISRFFAAISFTLDPELFKKPVNIALSSAKSSNPQVREHAELLFGIVLQKSASPENDRYSLNEIIGLAKSGKTAGPEHRLSLYRMLGMVKPFAETSSLVLDTLNPLLTRETNDSASQALIASASSHIIFHLKSDITLPSSVLSTLVKEMDGSKVALRRAMCSMVGDVLFSCHESHTSTATFRSLVETLIPAFNVNLKAVSSNPLSAPAGPLEGYVALACLLCFSSSSDSEKSVQKSVIDQALSGSNAKTFFLIWDKVYQKISNEDDEKWLVRATEPAFGVLASNMEKSALLRRQFGALLVYNATRLKQIANRKGAITSLELLHARYPRLVTSTAQLALVEALGKERSDSESRQHINYAPVLMACAFFGETSLKEKQGLLCDLLLVSHDPKIHPTSGQLWIEMCQRAEVDPLQLIVDYRDTILNALLNHPSDKTLESATRTVAFVAPSNILPNLVSSIKAGLTPSSLANISKEDLLVWETPEGTLFHDVLVSKNANTAQKKGKDAAMEKWDAEMRASLAAKKIEKAPLNIAKLSKQDKELIETQLRTESDTRRRVQAARDGVLKAFALLRAIVAAKPEEFAVFAPEIVKLVLEGPIRYNFPPGEASKNFLMLGELCSSRLENLALWIGTAVLRCKNASLVPEEMQAESLHALVLRLLYRLRSLSEKGPLDGLSFTFVSSFLDCVVHDHDKIGKGEDEDEPIERMVLVIEIVNYHAAEFSNKGYPRSNVLSMLFSVIQSFPSLGKDASSVLVALCEAIAINAARDEIAVLVQKTLSAESYVRNTALQCMQALDLTDLDWAAELWIMRYDNDQHNARLAQHVFDDNALDVPESFFDTLRPFLAHEFECIRTGCALSLPDAASQWPAQVHPIVESLKEFYLEKAKATGPEFDEYGILISRSLESSDPWPVRLAIARAFEAMSPLFGSEDVISFLSFLIIDNGLGDSKEEVRAGMLAAASQVVDLHGTQHLQAMIGLLESHLSKPSSMEGGDHIKTALVILLGRTARHLNAEDPRIPDVVSRLISALKTPSEQVQVAVSECLAPLVRFLTGSLPRLMESLLNDLVDAPKYGERRGAAYGVAGLMKGTGVAGIVKFDLVDRLRSALEDKKRYESRQGAMFAIETLSTSLGRTFEPFIIDLLPSLLTAFGDANADVREATEDAAKVIMANLSGYGIKRILPSLLSGLDEKQWRTKKGSIELLGTMAFCAPRQLSISLPTVIPRLSSVLTDSHTQVRGAASKSLKQFGEVISNPEIQSLVPVFLKAFVDPSRTPNAMTALLKKSFSHYIDSPSLALVVPIIERGLRERGSETKRKAAQIVGNLASLTDSQEFVPYLSRLLPLVHVVLVDPVPEARATAAKALGTLIERLGEEQFPDMVPGLLRTLKSDASGVDRQGAAQGLSEVLAGLGMERLEALLPDIVSNAQSPRSTVREGFMSLLIYLPATFGSRFQPHLTRVVGPILAGLSDTEDYVRDAAMKAGRMIITNYSNKAVDLLLPELERGMFDGSWRIRHSSITLVGELLFKVTGISGKAEIEEEEGDAVPVTTAETSRKALGETLGRERRDRILSALYVVRQDAVSAVRQSAIHIWKVLVHNTPRTVRELLPELVSQLVYLLVDEESDESSETASRTIGELCRKFGERILGEILPLLREKAESSDGRTRQGVCLALCDIMETATDTQRGGHEEVIVSIVRSSLVDEQANVRAAAARAFDSLQEHLGPKAIDQTIPTLLEALRQPGESSGTALQALKEVMSVRANAVFPVLIPTLTASPMTEFNVRALGTLVTVAGNALSKRLTQVLTSLVVSIENCEEGPLAIAINETLRALVGSISDAEGLNTLMIVLFDWLQTGNPKRRASACKIFGTFCEESKLDDSLYRVDWIRQLILLLDDNESVVSSSALQALELFVKSVPKDELEPLVVTLRRAIESTGGPGRTVPGFSLPKGIAPLVPIIIAGLTTGSHEQKENAAAAIGELVTRTEGNALKPFIVPFTGPLIRVAAQSTSYPPAVKSAILTSLTTMLVTVPSFVKPFFPQLQRTFVKSATDNSSLAVRNRAATALGVLMKSQPRVDPVVTELLGGIGTNEEAIASSQVNALAQVVKNAEDNVGVKARESCVELVEGTFNQSHDDTFYQAVGALFSALTRYDDLVEPLINKYLVAGTPPSALASQCILAVLVDTQEFRDNNGEICVFEKMDIVPSINRKIQESIGADRPSISRPAREAKEIAQKIFS